jgi:hypothetical protein
VKTSLKQKAWEWDDPPPRPTGINSNGRFTGDSTPGTRKTGSRP